MQFFISTGCKEAHSILIIRNKDKIVANHRTVYYKFNLLSQYTEKIHAKLPTTAKGFE
jgi:hypothetical protein